MNETNLADFFNQKMIEMNIGTGAPGNPVLAVQCNYEKNYAFVEFRSAEDATAAMAFDGIIFINGPLKIRRPKDYGGENLPASPGVHVPGIVSTNVPDSMNKIFVGGLPTYLNEEQVMELLKSFGELKAFNLVRENGNGPSKGFAFFEYVDPNVTDVAISSLNQMELGDRYLVVQRASVGAKSDGQGMIPNLPYDQFPEIPRPIMPAGQEITDARILLMLNMVTAEDLIEDDEYGDLYEDVKEETSKYGEVEDLRIPRPAKKDKAKWGESQLTAAEAARVDEAAGVGRVYVKYKTTEGSNNALNSLAGRSFAGRSIIATLLSEESQTTPPLNIIFAPAPEAPAVIRKEEWDSRLHEVPISKEDLNRLVMDYLVIEGFKGAAEEFSQEANLAPTVDFESIESRMIIRQALQRGDVEDAITRVNDLNPEILDTNAALYFRLQQQKLIEYIRAGRIADALQFAQEELAPRGEESPEFLAELERTMSLLAFENATNAPPAIADLLSPAQRMKTAGEVNAAILDSLSQGKEVKLVGLLKLLCWGESLLEEKAEFPKLNLSSA